MNVATVVMLSASALFAAAGQVLFKLGSQGSASVADFINWKIAVGLCLYAAGMVLWLGGLSRAPLYLIYPFTILTFVLVGAASIVIFGERPTALVVVGWVVTCAGFAIVQLGSSH